MRNALVVVVIVVNQPHRVRVVGVMIRGPVIVETELSLATEIHTVVRISEEVESGLAVFVASKLVGGNLEDG